MVNEITYKQFLTKEGMFVPSVDTVSTPRIVPGFYELRATDSGEPAFIPKTVMTESYIELPSMATTKVLEEITTFWAAKTRERYDQLGLIYKRGIIMYGAPGTGKTATIMKVAHRVVEEGGIVIYNPAPALFNSAICALRDIQGECKVLCIFEEFDKYCEKADFLGLLDGELQVANVVYVATTNHLDQIPNSLKKRPSRFATVIEVKSPEADAREIFIKRTLPVIDAPTLKALVKATNGLVLDQIKDVLISAWCFEMPLHEAIKNVRALGHNSVGISSNNDDNTISELNLFGMRIGSIKTSY